MPQDRRYYLEQATYWQEQSATFHIHAGHRMNMLSFAMDRGDARRAAEYALQAGKFQRRGARAANLARDYLVMARMVALLLTAD